jgi:lysyl-tRNA synthetase class 2
MPFDLERLSARARLFLRARARIVDLIRQWFDENGFLEVETPCLCRSPGFETHIDAFEVSGGRVPLFLATSPEFFMKRLLSAGFDRIYQTCKVFRRNETGEHHNPEFTMLEWYRKGATYLDIMADCENLLCEVSSRFSKTQEAKDLGVQVLLKAPFARRKFSQVFEDCGALEAVKLPVAERLQVFVEKVEPMIGRRAPEFIYDYPKDMASLARIRKVPDETAERFELYAFGLELANGFTEITDSGEFVARYMDFSKQREAMGLPAYEPDWHYVRMLKEGLLPPCAGVAMGVDRVIMLLCKAKSIKEAIAFPFDTL